MKIKKVVIPAAGLGTRFFPATKSFPKEMLPIIDKPCIQYLVEEAVASGIKEIIIVTGQNKRSIKDHFSFASALHSQLKAKKKIQALKEIQKVENLAKIKYVKQPIPLGDGDAILCAKKYIGKEPFAVLFGDDIYDSQIPALSQLIKQYEKFNSPIIALEKINKKDCRKYGMIEIDSKKDNAIKIKNLIEKPGKAPSNFAIAGKYIITPELFKTLEKSKPGRDKELRLIDGLRKFVKHSSIYGYEIQGKRFDTGDKLGYLKAVIYFGLKHTNFGKELKKEIKGY